MFFSERYFRGHLNFVDFSSCVHVVIANFDEIFVVKLNYGVHENQSPTKYNGFTVLDNISVPSSLLEALLSLKQALWNAPLYISRPMMANMMMEKNTRRHT